MSDLHTMDLKAFKFSFNFNDTDGNTVGSIFIEDGQIQFDGFAEESAKVFLDYLKIQFSQHIDELVEKRLTEVNE